jgi:HNH endonuclease
MDDQFKHIDGFPGYRVSRDGEVQSRWRRGSRGRMTDTWLPLKPIRRRSGHLVVNLHRDGKKTARYIHHLVLEAFVGPRPEGLVCCHWDGNPTNNRVENLRWDTHRANGADTIRHGRRKFGEEAGSKLIAADVLEVRRKYAQGARKSQLAAEYGVTGPQIGNIVHRRAWRHLPAPTDPPTAS